MSKKHDARQRVDSGNTPVRNTLHHDWLEPVSDTAPCGPDLEYDHDFVVLFASAAPKQDVQYGDFVGSPDPLNWSELERDCRRLMMRTKDIRVAVLYTRCRTRLGGVGGLAEGTGLLAAWLQAFTDHIHPQPDIDGERETALEMQMNALQALADPEGLLADVREIVLTRSTIARLQLRDVERAFAQPRPADALAPESVMQQLQDLRKEHPVLMASFDDTIANLAAIDAWCVGQLEAYQPDLSPLTRLLRKLGASAQATTVETVEQGAECSHAIDDAAAQGPAAAATSTPRNAAPATVLEHMPAHCSSAPADRQAALALIRTAKTWFETHEPSSPIPVLLERAEQLAGKRYAEIVKAIPADLLAQWEEAKGE
ncbi:type VI secretion protein ImpA [Burkholderia ubonensis]|uniref:type VI secretion system protein TssA n=1 Tax=Burkholderia ubonensis TaxID=101571 RepID=UPI00075CA8BD|nr:type VI secretion system ImpA family N-terminal domain-containing protein [Burkholderia ubonensis]KWA70836.1 type VI secretion protein ImpA [Burkholderia ubonensis]KWB28529.1 type VI secretion protein ImpA [Burkholderia ubonensis]